MNKVTHKPESPFSFLGTAPRIGALAVAASLALAACGDAESREDLEGEPIPAEEMAADRAPGENRGEPAPAAMPHIPAGERLVFEVRETVSTADHDAGDTFTLRLVRDVEGVNGARLPQGTEARGMVALAEESTGPEDESALVVVVESILVEGEALPLEGEVESATTETATRDSGARSAAKVATGAAAGAVIGQILGGDTRSTVQGAVAGAVAGIGVAVTTREGHATLPEGSRVTVRLDEPLPAHH